MIFFLQGAMPRADNTNHSCLIFSVEKESRPRILQPLQLVTAHPGAATANQVIVKSADCSGGGGRLPGGGSTQSPVEGDAGQLAVGHHLEDDVLIAVAEGGAEGVGGVGGGGPVEHDGAIAWAYEAGDLLPAGEGGEDHRGERDGELVAAAAG